MYYHLATKAFLPGRREGEKKKVYQFQYLPPYHFSGYFPLAFEAAQNKNGI
jgi:hypothetical protein